MKNLFYGMGSCMGRSSMNDVDKVIEVVSKREDIFGESVYWFFRVWKFDSGCFR